MNTNQAPQQIIDKVLSLIPQKYPFRFVDEILSLTPEKISGSYLVKGDEYFFAGHFPGKPTMPGVIIIEAMAQVAVVALGIYDLLLAGNDNFEKVTLFTECEIEFFHTVTPKTRLIIYGEKVYFRREKIKSKAWVTLEDGTLIAQGYLAGIGVKNE